MNAEQIRQFFSDSTDFHGNIKLNENLSSHTTMHVGGEAKIFLEPEDSDSMIFALNYLIEEKCGFFILGGGSKEEPTVVVLLQQVGMKVYLLLLAAAKGVVSETDDHAIGDIVEQRAQQQPGGQSGMSLVNLHVLSHPRAAHASPAPVVLVDGFPA